MHFNSRDLSEAVQTNHWYQHKEINFRNLGNLYDFLKEHDKDFHDVFFDDALDLIADYHILHPHAYRFSYPKDFTKSKEDEPIIYDIWEHNGEKFIEF